jgi:hypothetical protein
MGLSPPSSATYASTIFARLGGRLGNPILLGLVGALHMKQMQEPQSATGTLQLSTFAACVPDATSSAPPAEAATS